jgi:hypothetical protein
VSQTFYVEYRECGFWTYDVALAIFLKHLIDAAMPRAASPGGEWLARAISDWQITAVVPDCGTVINETWSEEQIDTFIELTEQACNMLEGREKIEAEEITAWSMLDDLRIFVRGATEVCTAPVVELGRAMIALVKGELPTAPHGTAWFYGTPRGRETIRMRQ